MADARDAHGDRLGAAFAAAVTGLIGRPLGAAEPVAVAVSGGSDSLALLALAHAAFADRVRVLTVDHGLQVGSAAAAAAVADRAAMLRLDHATLAWTGAKPAGNLQAAARMARYELMRDWCVANRVAWLATAHHADDQAETLLLRLARGAGPGGLSGIRARRDLGGGVTLLRPVLSWRRADLAAIVTDRGWLATGDPANADLRFDRTHARALLATTPWLDGARLAASAATLADAEAALTWTADLAWQSRVIHAGPVVTVDAADLPHAVVRRLIVRALTAVMPGTALPGPAVERLLARLTAGRAATLGGVLVRPTGAGGWRFSAAPPRRRGT